jgi:hypothetical protein
MLFSHSLKNYTTGIIVTTPWLFTKVALCLFISFTFSKPMKKLTFLLLLGVLFIFGSWTSGTNTYDEYVRWNEDTKLTWGHFRGVASPSSTADAATAVHISARPYRIKKKIFYTVEAYFIPNQSWCRSRSERLLGHEQLHFDIAELYARKARKKISEYRQMGIKDVNTYNEAVSRILQESNSVDLRYDFDTLHGTMQDKQEQWEKDIATELRILSDFSSKNWK